MTPAFLVTALVVVATPGTGALYTIAAGLTRGSRAAVLAAFACTLGIVPHLAAAVTGLAAVMHTSAMAFQVVKVLGVGYLLWLAWTTWRDTGSLSVEGSAAGPATRRGVLVQGITVNVLNPKLTVFFFALLPQFAGTTGLLLGLSAVFMAMTFVVFAAYGVVAAHLRERVLARPRLLDRVRKAFAVCFGSMAVRLATESR